MTYEIEFKVTGLDEQSYNSIIELLKTIKQAEITSSQNNGKPLVSGSVPKFDADGFKRWMSGWVEPKHIPTIAAYVEKMLGGNDR